MTDARRIQRAIAILELEARATGFNYTAEFLEIAAAAMGKEIAMDEAVAINGKNPLESVTYLQ